MIILKWNLFHLEIPIEIGEAERNMDKNPGNLLLNNKVLYFDCNV